MRFKAAIGAVALLAAVGLSQVLAQPFPRQGGFPGKAPGQPAPGQGQFDRQARQPQAPERAPVEQRMSPEERQQLRRDIEQHGREIYPDRGRQGRR